MLRIDLLQQFFGLSAPAMEEALHDVQLYGAFAPLMRGSRRRMKKALICDSAICSNSIAWRRRFWTTVNAELVCRGMLLRIGTVVDVTPIDAPSSTKKGSGKRNSEMRPSKKANQRSFGMQTHRGVAADSGLVLTVKSTAANVHDVTQAAELLHGDETVVFADAGYRGVEKRPEVKVRHPAVNWQVAMMPSKRRVLSDSPSDLIVDQIEQMKASVCGKAEHPFRVIKC